MHRTPVKSVLPAWFSSIQRQKFSAHSLFDTCVQTQLDLTYSWCRIKFPSKKTGARLQAALSRPSWLCPE